MKRILVVVSIAISIFILVSCSSKNYVITSGYENMISDDAAILIPPINITDVNDNLKIFSGEEIDEIKDNFNTAASDSLAEYMNVYSNSTAKFYHSDYRTAPQFEEKHMKVGGNEITLNIPVKTVQVDEEVTGNSFILLLENSSITLDAGKDNSSAMPGMDGTTGATSANGKMKTSVVSLSMNINYVLYDNTNEQVAYYGMSHYRESFKKFEEVKSIIERGLKNISEEIISNSPVK